MLRAFLLSVGQLGDPPVLRVLALSIAATLAVFVAGGAAVWWGVHLALAGWTGGDGIAAVAALAVTVLALWLLFRAVAIAVVGLFADDVVAAVEARHYPAALATARPVPFARGAVMGLRSALRVVAVNLLMLPLYLLLLATGIGTAAAFFLVNGWLLGRDLGDMVAARHLPRAEIAGWRRATTARRFLLGLAGTGLLLVPIVNLVAPVIGAAMATHLFHRRRA